MTCLLAAATKPDLAVFVVASAMIILGALGVVISRNPIHAVLSLIVTLFGVAVTFISQDAQFLAAVQVIVYAGAIVVLFLFVIMLLGVDRKEDRTRNPLRLQLPLALVGVVAAISLLIALVGRHWSHTGGPSQAGRLSGGGSNISTLADSIFTQYLFPFEATSILLVIAVIGAVVLARRPNQYQQPPDSENIEADDGSEPELPYDSTDREKVDA